MSQIDLSKARLRWPRFPLDPDCTEFVAYNHDVFNAIKRLIRDWDGVNWNAVRGFLRNHGYMDAEMRALDATDENSTLYQAFATAPAEWAIFGTAPAKIAELLPADSNFVPLPEHLDILQCLAQAYTVLKEDDIVEHSGHKNNKKVRALLRDLTENLLVDRPFGVNKGNRIRPEGRRLLEKAGRPSTPKPAR